MCDWAYHQEAQRRSKVLQRQSQSLQGFSNRRPDDVSSFGFNPDSNGQTFYGGQSNYSKGVANQAYCCTSPGLKNSRLQQTPQGMESVDHQSACLGMEGNRPSTSQRWDKTCQQEPVVEKFSSRIVSNLTGGCEALPNKKNMNLKGLANMNNNVNIKDLLAHVYIKDSDGRNNERPSYSFTQESFERNESPYEKESEPEDNENVFEQRCKPWRRALLTKPPRLPGGHTMEDYVKNIHDLAFGKADMSCQKASARAAASATERSEMGKDSFVQKYPSSPPPTPMFDNYVSADQRSENQETIEENASSEQEESYGQETGSQATLTSGRKGESAPSTPDLASQEGHDFRFPKLPPIGKAGNADDLLGYDRPLYGLPSVLGHTRPTGVDSPTVSNRGKGDRRSQYMGGPVIAGKCKGDVGRISRGGNTDMLDCTTGNPGMIANLRKITRASPSNNRNEIQVHNATPKMNLAEGNMLNLTNQGGYGEGNLIPANPARLPNDCFMNPLQYRTIVNKPEFDSFSKSRNGEFSNVRMADMERNARGNKPTAPLDGPPESPVVMRWNDNPPNTGAGRAASRMRMSGSTPIPERNNYSPLRNLNEDVANGAEPARQKVNHFSGGQNMFGPRYVSPAPVQGNQPAQNSEVSAFLKAVKDDLHKANAKNFPNMASLVNS